jgi:CheY-like chemotaxis protein
MVQRFSLLSRCEQHSSNPSPQRPVSIFLAEDNPADALLVREALEEHGVEGELIVVSDGESAIKFIQTIDEGDDCPNLAVIDLNLPKRSGRDVLGAMRLSAKCSSIPIIVLSSSNARQDKDEAAYLGASRYIRKPSRLAEFLALGSIFKSMATDPSLET